MSNVVTITLSPKILAELEPIQAETHESLEIIVNLALTEYSQLWKKQKIREQMAKQYDELADMWAELADDLADERWLSIENEALLQTEKTLSN